MNTNEKGNIGLAKVLTSLTELGYYCFLPFTDTTCVDLIVANKSMKVKRVQIKYRKKNNKGVNDRSKIDYYIVYCPDNDKTYFIDLDKIGNVKTFSLRVDSTQLKSENIRYASEFEKFQF